MTEPTPETKTEERKAAAPEIHSYKDVIKSLKGKVVTIVNPESLEEAPMGYQLTTGFYRAKVLGVQGDFVTCATELVRKGREKATEPVKQFIPVDRVKRITVGKAEILLHL